MRDLAAHDAGRLDLAQDASTFSLMLELGGDVFWQTVQSDASVMQLGLDGRQGKLYRVGAEWTGSADALELLADCRLQMEIVTAIAEQAQLGFGMVTPWTPPSSDLNFCCSSIPVNASGWAFRWQMSPAVEACALAHRNLEARYRFLTGGLECSKAPTPSDNGATTCNSCIDLFTGYLCTATAYLNYLC